MSEESLLSFGENIRRLRVSLNMSQDELAEKCGYTDRSSIAKIESGKADVPQKKIKVFADALNVSPSVLLEKRAVETSFISEENYYHDEYTRDLADFLHKNPDYKVLFDASRKVKPEDIDFVKTMIERMGGNDGTD